MYQAIENERLPAHIICITPEYKGEQLAQLAASKGLDPAIFAYDPENSKNTAAHYRSSNAGITDERVLDLWWMVERGKPGAIAAASKFAKKNDDAATLLATIQQRYDQRAAELLQADATLETFEHIEAWITEHQGLNTKELSSKDLSRDKALANELRARTAYINCMRLISSNKTKEQQAGRDGLSQIAEKMPDTVYGKKAAQ